MIKLEDIRETATYDDKKKWLNLFYSVTCDNGEEIASQCSLNPQNQDDLVKGVLRVRANIIDNFNEAFIGRGYTNFRRPPNIEHETPDVMKDERL